MTGSVEVFVEQSGDVIVDVSPVGSKGDIGIGIKSIVFNEETGRWTVTLTNDVEYETASVTEALETYELNTANSASAAATQAGVATTQAGIATTRADEAAGSASTATTQAGIATGAAGTATTQAGIATTQAGVATTKAGEAATSESTSTTKAGEASTSAELSQAWAEGTEPGGTGTKSAKDHAADAQASADRIDLGSFDADVSATSANAEQAALDAAATAADRVQTGLDRAAAEAARDAAFVNADVYADISTGRAAVADGEQFQVVDGDEIVRYRRDDASNQTEMARYYSAEGVANQVQGYLVPLPANRLPMDLDYPSSLDMRSGSEVVDAPAGELSERGYSKAIQWRSGSDYARWSSGEDQNGQYVFGAFLVYSTNASNIPLSPKVFSESSGGSIFDLANRTTGRVDLSSKCALLWVTGQVNRSGDENILIGDSSTPADNTRYAGSFTILTSDAAFDGEEMARQILLRDQVRQDANARAAAKVAEVPTYRSYPNALEYGDYYGGSPETRSATPVISLPVGGLRDFGYNRGIDFGDRVGGNNFWRYSAGEDLNGKYVMGVFLAEQDGGSDLPLTVIQYTEAVGGGLDTPVSIDTGSQLIADGVYLHWGTCRPDRAGDQNYLIGSTDSLAVGEVYCTGVFVFVSDSPIDREAVIAAYLNRQATMADAVRRVEGGTSEGARLVLSGSGDVESYVESSNSGVTIKNTFTPFPASDVDSYPVLFNINDNFVDGIAVRSGVGDDTPPDHLFDATIGGNHGYRLGRLTATGHGKAQADQGSVWSSGGTEYLLIQVVDANTLLVTERSGNGAPPTGTYTHVSGATNTADIVVTAQSYAQWYPPFQDRTITLFVDGKKITDTTGKFSYRDSVQFVEAYDILAKSEMLAWWEANGASGNIEPSGAPSIRITNTYEYDRDGQLVIYRDWFVLESLTVNDLMGIQSARAAGTTHYYIPNTVEFTHDGDTVNYSLIEAADRTSTGGQVSVNFAAAQCEATGPYVDRVLSLIGSDYVFAQGFLPMGDVADDSARRTLCSAKGLEIRGNTDKLYFRVVDKGDFVAQPGDHWSAIVYRHIFPRPADRTAAYPVRKQGADYLYMDWHGVSKIDRVPVPPDYAGREFEVVSSRNATAYGDFLAGELNVNVDASGSDYGFLVLKVL